ncbi:MAG: thioredoxin-dependent thiol peroxidase [Nanoarchaeota archaeon]|nr:thioredoxin-dependent thiol peroxidase [Nanoarchaeota archaeon]
MIKINEKAPDFTAKALINNEEKEIKLSDFKNKKIILYFYPKDLTPGCTTQACNLRDNSSELTKKGFEVIGVSADDEKKHQRFIGKYELPFTLLADVEKKVINAYGVWGPKKFMGRTFDGIHRTTFVIDEKGMIEKVITKVKTKNHTKQILEELNFN